MALLRVPVMCVVTGEGGSGGAIAIGVGDRVLMLENAIYSVISPEGCAAILFRNRDKASKAAESLKLTATDLLQFGIIDEIVKEPTGGSHRDYERSASILRRVLRRHLDSLRDVPIDTLLEERYNKYRNMGIFKE
jgi:acetyl-CoA carboxylase carboxyl transferase subunit alpha